MLLPQTLSLSPRSHPNATKMPRLPDFIQKGANVKFKLSDGQVPSGVAWMLRICRARIGKTEVRKCRLRHRHRFRPGESYYGKMIDGCGEYKKHQCFCRLSVLFLAEHMSPMDTASKEHDTHWARSDRDAVNIVTGIWKKRVRYVLEVSLAGC